MSIKHLLLSALLATPFTALADDDDHHVALKDCPAAVQETIKANLGAGRLDEVDLYEVDGARLYIAEVDVKRTKQGDDDFKLHINGEGKLLKTVVDRDDDDDDRHDD
jgi:hypothetical protein